jgi:CheY-like chemotaxis protein
VNKNGPILIIEDDVDDQHFIEDSYRKLNYQNELVFLDNGEIAITYLMQMTRIPFLIISDLNMPKINGIELRARVKENDAINIKCVPYVIFSTTVARNFIDDAYTLGIQGYFKKPNNPDDLMGILKHIIDYWKISYTPGMYM